jgi:monofunctional biosynthetic peptidoglycan transglycosylase
MSPYVPRSVVAAEDAHFCKHHGIDWGALREAIDDAKEDGTPFRGASTITQQVAKNLFLWQGRDFVRKALEFPLALWIDLVLPKQRILEIYLNIAELGPQGQFGVETGSAYAFGKSAASLSPREAALLASILPNPVKRSARTPGPGVRRLAGTYVARGQASSLLTCWRENR